MIGLQFHNRSGLARTASELVEVPLQMLNGQSLPNKQNVKYPLPPVGFDAKRVVQVIAYNRGALSVPDGRASSIADISRMFICLARADGPRFFWLDMPVVRLLNLDDRATGSFRSKPMYLEPTMIDTRRSYVYTSSPVGGNLFLEFIYID